MAKNPHYLSQMSHVELFSTNMEETVRFYTEIVGMDITATDDNSTYLRAWGDYFLYTLKITQSDTQGNVMGWRADSPESLNECIVYLESVGAGIGWVEADKGRGKAYRFQSPGGLIHEVFWEVVWHKETGKKGSIFADRYASNRRKGACPRRYDHATYLVPKTFYAKEKAFWKGMGLKNPDEIRISDEIPPVGGLYTIGNLSHDIAIFTDPNLELGTNGILNHICYNVDSREEVLLALDWFVENGHESVWGAPTRHKADEGFFIYIMEPHTGVLLEIYACARLIFAPDHGPDVHYLKDNPNDAWGKTNPFKEMEKGKVGGLKPVDI